MYIFKFKEPALTGDVNQDKRNWNHWHAKWKFLAERGGRPHMQMSVWLWSMFFIAIILWHWLGSYYSYIGRFGDASLDWLFADPLSGVGDKLSDKMDRARDAMKTQVWPYIYGVQMVSTMYDFYWAVHVITVVLVVIQSMQYLQFQKRLSSVADTFSGIADELIHMSFVTLLVCFLFGVINSLAFGSYDPAFANIGDSFYEMVLVCFGLFKPAAGTLYVESLFKFASHVRITADFMTWVPIVLQIGFKLLVILLLFKLLMGVIMEGYKKHSKNRDNFPTMREDLIELCTYYRLKILHKFFLKDGFVSFLHIALALGRLAGDDDRPSWQQSYCGLESAEEVKTVLNSIFDREGGPSVPTRVTHAVKLAKLKEVGDVEVAWVLKYYGVDRQKAFAKFSNTLHREKGEEEAKEELIKLNLKRLTASSGKDCPDDRAKLRQTLVEMKGPDDKFVKKIFREYDIFQLGYLNHHAMPQVFHQLGYNVRSKNPAFPHILHKVLVR
jgi:hypothetical protein